MTYFLNLRAGVTLSGHWLVSEVCNKVKLSLPGATGDKAGYLCGLDLHIFYN